MSIARITSNLRALLSVSRRRPSEASEAGDPPLELLDSQHGSGSTSSASSSTPSRGQEREFKLYDEQYLATLSDEEFNARIEESRAELASMKRPNKEARVPPEDQLWRGSNPSYQDDWRSGPVTDRTMKVERSSTIANLGPTFNEMSQEQLPEIEERTSEKKIFC